MPRRTQYSDEFGRLVREAVAGLSNDAAGKRADVAAETIRRMTNGKVPEEDVLKRFLVGFPDVDETALRIAAGLIQPETLEERVKLSMNGLDWLDDQARNDILDFVREKERKHTGGDADLS